MAAQNTKPELSMAAKLRDEGDKLLAERSLEVGDTTLPPKEQSNLEGKPVRVKTNFFKINMDKKIAIHQYKVIVKVNLPNDHGFSPNDPEREDRGARRVENLKMARNIFDLCVGLNSDVFVSRDRLYFDGDVLLFSLDQLPLGGKSREFVVNSQESPDSFNAIHTRALSFTVNIESTATQVCLLIPPDLGAIKAESCADNRSLLHFLDIATGEHASKTGQYVVYENGCCYLLNPQNHGYSLNDMPLLEFGIYLALGINKSVRLIGDSPKNIMPALVIDPKVTPFHMVQSVAEKVLSAFKEFERNPNGSLAVVSRMLAGLYVSCRHIKGTVPLKQIKDVVQANAHTAERFEYDGKQVTVAQYFKERYKITLRHPNLPLLRMRGGGRERTVLLPMELCDVADDQVVKSNQAPPTISPAVLKASTRLPIKLNEEIRYHGEALQLDNSPSLQQANITVDRNAIEVDGKVIKSPVMLYQDGNPVQYDLIKGNWRPGYKFSVPAGADIWAIYALETDPRKKFTNPQMLRQYSNAFVAECRKHGMQMADPVECEILRPNQNTKYDDFALEERFMEAKKGGCRYIMLLTSESDKAIHHILKDYERTHQILTQNVTSFTAIAAAGLGNAPPKRLTMENIVNKANMKLGGLNYVLGDSSNNSFIGEDDLFIGIAANHPGGGLGTSGKPDDSPVAQNAQNAAQNAPTVVGFSSNDLKTSCEFSGGYYYQESRRDEKFKLIEKIVSQCVERFVTHRKRAPKVIYLYRNGCSEGQFENIMTYEIPLAQAVVKKVAPTAKLVVIVPNRIHNVRLMPANINRNEKAPGQNLQPGTLVDSGITHPFFNEFYLLGHLGRLGTAKVPRFTVISNPGNVPTDQIKKVTYQLAFGIQIITGTVSLPVPVFLALEFAKRGRNIYTVNTNQSVTHFEKLNGSTYDRVNEELTYDGLSLAADGQTLMRDLRYNA